MALGHGDQLRVSGATAQLLPPGAFSLIDLGEHFLRDVDEPTRVYQVKIDGVTTAFPPLRGDRRPVHIPRARDRLIGREDDLADLIAAVSDHRLVTLIGVGAPARPASRSRRRARRAGSTTSSPSSI